MTKFFRRHSRIFLLLFMAVLMVVFVIGQAVGRSGRGGQMADAEIGTAHGEPVRQSDLRTASADFEIASMMGMLPRGLGPLHYLADQNDLALTVHLLSREAHDLGISVSQAQIMQLLKQNGIQDAQFDAVRERYKISRDGLLASLSRTMAIGVLFRTQLEAALAVPLPQLELAYRDRAQRASVKVSVIDAEAFLDQVDPPTEEQLQAQFEAGKDRETKHTPEATEYGYRLPDRIKLEYLTVDPTQIEDLVMIREVDAKRFYEVNKSKYKKQVAGPAGVDTANTPTVQETYEEARDQVREAVRSLEAIKEAQRLINSIQAEARREWTAASKKGAEPAESFEALASRFSTQYQVKWQTTGWIERSDFMTVPVLGTASFSDEGKRVQASTMAFDVEGLATDETDETAKTLKVNEPSPVFVTYRINATGHSQPYQAVVFRVTGVKPAAPPDSLDEVRDKVTEDVMMQEAFDKAGNEAKALADTARTEGLDQAVEQDEQLRKVMATADASKDENKTDTQPARQASRTGYLAKLLPFAPPSFGRSPIPIHGIHSQLLTDKIFDPQTAKSADGHHVVVVPAADKHAWIVAELLDVKPMYAGEFDKVRGTIEQRTQQMNASTFQYEWCNPDNVKKRADYVAKEVESKTDEEADESKAS